MLLLDPFCFVGVGPLAVLGCAVVILDGSGYPVINPPFVPVSNLLRLGGLLVLGL